MLICGMILSFIGWVLNCNVAAENRSYFRFECPSIYLSGTTVSLLSDRMWGKTEKACYRIECSGYPVAFGVQLIMIYFAS